MRCFAHTQTISVRRKTSNLHEMHRPWTHLCLGRCSGCAPHCRSEKEVRKPPTRERRREFTLESAQVRLAPRRIEDSGLDSGRSRCSVHCRVCQVVAGALTPVPYGGFSSDASIALDLNGGIDRLDRITSANPEPRAANSRITLPPLSSLLYVDLLSQ
jgi:hypothetical protein